jgi:hypothetical protein
MRDQSGEDECVIFRNVQGQDSDEPQLGCHLIGVCCHHHGGNVAVLSEAGGVEFLLHAESNSPIDVMVTFTVFDPVESFDVIS